MKKLNYIASVVSGILFIISFLILPVTAQSVPKGKKGKKPIPENVMKIVKKSCLKCHVSEGNSMASAKVNFSKWDKYSAKKQAKKANMICNIVSEDKMPPKKFKENHPDAIPTKEEIKMIYDWAQSLQVIKK
jgi:hypothetical protein